MLTLLIIHNILRWLVLAAGLWTVINAITGLAKRRAYNTGDNRSSLLFLSFFDLQLLIGLYQFYQNGWLDKMKAGMGNVMKSNYDRFFIVEHAMMMIIALVLVHIGRSSVKKAVTDRSKHKKMLAFFGIALLLIFISIPWPFRAEVARPLFRWFN